MTDATKSLARVSRYLDEYAKGSHAGDDIHLLHVGSDREAQLTVSDLRAILALAAPAEGWQGIETAPKSTSQTMPHGKFVKGVYLLGFIPDNAGPDLQTGIDVIWWEPNAKENGAWFGPDAEPCNPTHWMPLPAAPTGETGA